MTPPLLFLFFVTNRMSILLLDHFYKFFSHKKLQDKTHTNFSYTLKKDLNFKILIKI